MTFKTPTDIESLALGIDCPSCARPAGVWCITNPESMRMSPKLHADRRSAARVAPSPEDLGGASDENVTMLGPAPLAVLTTTTPELVIQLNGLTGVLPLPPSPMTAEQAVALADDLRAAVVRLERRAQGLPA